MKFLLLFIAMLTSSLVANSLADYRWKKRLIVISVPAEKIKPIENLMTKHKAAIKDRDLVFINLGSRPIQGTLQPNAAQRKTLLKTFKVEKTKPTFILVGKDGSTKARQHEQLKLPKFFALIDKMPMRRNEIRRSKNK